MHGLVQKTSSMLRWISCKENTHEASTLVQITFLRMLTEKIRRLSPKTKIGSDAEIYRIESEGKQRKTNSRVQVKVIKAQLTFNKAEEVSCWYFHGLA